VKFFLGILVHYEANVKQLVLAGLAITTLLQVYLATLSKAFP